MATATDGQTQPDIPIIILYHYHYSPFARRVQWYLALRGIPYSQCMQPPIMPRPDIARLGIRYRRIPILAIGRDVYLDTRLIIQKLEELVPARPITGSSAPIGPRLGAPRSSRERALEHLLESYTVDAGGFTRAAQLIPPTLPLMRDPAFQRDRADFRGDTARLQPPPARSVPPPSSDGGEKSKAPSARREQAMEAVRAEAVTEICLVADFLEHTLLADGVPWVAGGWALEDGPGLVDIEAIWLLHWVTTMPGSMSPEDFSAERFPRVFAWIGRFNAAIATATKRNREAWGTGGEAEGKNKNKNKKNGGRDSHIPVLTGERAAEAIANSPFAESEAAVDAGDPVVREQGLRKGSDVTVWPLDTGSSHKDAGRLVGMDAREVVFETSAGDDPSAAAVRVHAPRHGFRVRAGRAAPALPGRL